MPKILGRVDRRKGSEAGEPSFLTSTCASQNQIDGGHGSDVVSTIPRGHRKGITYATVRAVKKKLVLRVPAVLAARHREVTESTQSRLEVHMGRVCRRCLQDMEWISRRYANRGLLGVDKFMMIERLGLAGLGLPAMSRQGLVFPSCWEGNDSLSGAATISSSISTARSCIVSA